jgi:hypothetical protein
LNEIVGGRRVAREAKGATAELRQEADEDFVEGLLVVGNE